MSFMRYNPAPGSQGLCPPGWHVPTESEWAMLSDYYQGSSKAGRPLQDSTANGFAATGSGVFYSGASWNFMDFATIFWTSTPSGQDKAISHGMNSVNYSVSLYPAGRGNAFGARCLRDQ
jgi:uncharacterized protein (TIGR02145 family)